MLEIFYPEKIMDSVYHISFENLRDRGIRGVIFDIDNTLVPHGAPADEEVKKLFRHLHNLGFKTCLLSNNKVERVASFAKEVDSLYIYKAGKPSVKGYREAMAQMRTHQATTIFVGDQIFTDILGANRAGIYSVLVKPINPKEEIQIVLKRYPEKLILFFFRRKRLKTKQTDFKIHERKGS